MRTLVIGSGGREHALALALSRDPGVDAVHVAPGNPGTAAVAQLHAVDPLDGAAVATLAADQSVDLVVIGPEAPLVAGVADAVRARGIACFGPSREAARIEGSKAFAKQVMAAAEVPTGLARICTSAEEVTDAVDAFGPPYVVKDDGLAGGKGVVVTEDRSAALAHAAGCDRVLVEEFLSGPEVSLFAVTDGSTVVPMLPAQDFKRVGDGDTGPNTGGMGAYAPVPWASDGLVQQVCDRVLQPTVEEMARRGTPFQGLLYAGLALTGQGVKVVEFNARFGDPETQPLLALLDSPLGTVLLAAAQGRADELGPLRWRDGAAVAVVLAAKGYPGTPRPGDAVRGLAAASAHEDVEVFHAGTALDGDRLVTAGGRVLTVTAAGADVAAARKSAYEAVAEIEIDGAFHRTDIAAGV